MCTPYEKRREGMSKEGGGGLQGFSERRHSEEDRS